MHKMQKVRAKQIIPTILARRVQKGRNPFVEGFALAGSWI